jgi:pilus assembly protein CpaB
MNKVAIVPLAMGVIIGGIAIKLGLDTLQKAKADGRQEEFSVVVAAVDIPATAAIEHQMLTTVKTVQTPILCQDSFLNLEDAVGRVVTNAIAKGSVLRESLLTPPGTPPGLAVRIKSGYRAVTVKVNEVTGVAYQVTPGARVDVIAVMTLQSGRSKETVSRIILQNIEVAAVGRALNMATTPDGKGKAAKSITLLVKNTDAPLLHLAQTRGKLTLALRSDDDTRESGVGNATESELLDGFGKTVAAKPQPSLTQPTNVARTVAVVHGGRLQQQELGEDISQGARPYVPTNVSPPNGFEPDYPPDDDGPDDHGFGHGPEGPGPRPG